MLRNVQATSGFEEIVLKAQECCRYLRHTQSAKAATEVGYKRYRMQLYAK